MRSSRLLQWAVPLSVLLLCAGAWAEDVPRMTKDELKPLLGKGNLVLVDVRAGGDWSLSDEKIVGAVRGDPWHVETWLDKVPRDKILVLYCA